MNFKIITALLFLSSSFAQTIKIQQGDLYLGQETNNGHQTGEACYVQIDSIEGNEKGKHCFDITWRFLSNRKDVLKDYIKASSRITNYHRREYPQLKTCAVNIDGTTDGADIYSEDTTLLYNQVFVGMHKLRSTQYDYILSFNAHSKTLASASFHILKWHRKNHIRCVNLKKL
ncbi:hypothetical protein M902_2975 [Bacteriovorax sp. BAL6_X]|uniref:hypothetical protein n=1 Tax=Bacteriovorax sp. BAL6_X TaxID=1201290 RepID=UPI0003861483|nr:hypothetical protein [Bacteriovorax sp. BAL6_X]EPZ51437.1 hypothetical protein M902_2975 [Bacteriovorax sp. BAL6_X]